MKKYMRFIMTLAALLMVGISAQASGKVKLYGSTSNVTYAISTTSDGTYTQVTADGIEHTKNTTVYLKVTPATGYTIAKSAITVKQAVSGSNAQTRNDGPVIVGTITLSGDDPTDLSSERIYSFTMPNDDNINVLISGDATAAVVGTSVPVFLTAGQSNTAGRCMNDNLPDYIKTLGTNNNGAYQYCNWSYTNGSTRKSESEGVFRKFWPEMESASNSGRFAYDAIVYYWIEQALQKNFYVVKHAQGGTSIDPTCTSTNDYHWSADATWLAEHASCNTEGGTSMLKAFCDNIGKSLDAIVADGKTYDIKAMIWHQGESDRSGTGPDGYHDNLKAVVKYVRDYLVAKTGDSKYANLDFICGTVPKNSKQYNKKVYDALFTLASEDSHFHVIETSPGTFIGDDLHFDTNCAERLGIGMYNKMVDLGLVSGTKQDVPDVIYPEGQPVTLDFKTWATENVGEKSEQKALTLSSESIKALDGTTDLYKAIGCEADGDFSEFAETFALSANEVKMRGSVGLQLASNKVITFSILNLNPGDGVTITFGAGTSGTTTLAALSENIFVSDDATQTILAAGTALTSKTVTYVVKSGNQIDLTFGSTGGHYINSIVITPDAVEILPTKPTVTLKTDGDEEKVYTVTFLEGETLHYTSPNTTEEQTVVYSTENNGSVDITVTRAGDLVCWTTRGTSTTESAKNTTTVIFSSGEEPTTAITIHTIGDSTMSSYDQSIPAQAGMDGWGDYLQDCMKEGLVTVNNWADRGETAKSYYNGIWEKLSSDRPEFGEAIKNKVNAGDYVIIQFGHNDSKAYSTVKYEEWLGTLVDAIKAKGAIPIMASSICRARFDSNGKITRLGRIDTYEDSGRILEDGATIDDYTFDYPYHAKQVATAKGIEFIDVTSGVKEMFETYGEAKTKALFPSGEKTHTNKLGAQLIAKVAAKLLLNTAISNYVDQTKLELPSADDIDVVIDDFGTEATVAKKTIWTFDDQTAEESIADDTNTVVNRNGLYVRGGATGRAIIAKTSDLSSVSFSDGTTQNVTIMAQTAGAHTTAASTIGQNTAGRSAANALAPTFALNIATPGTFYAIMAPTKQASDRYMRLVFSGKEVVSVAVNDAYAATNHLCELKFHAESTGVIYLSAGIASNLYAAMFVPDMEAGTEEDWNYQMLKTRENGYWTYTNMSGNNQSVPDGLTAYAVTEIDAEGKAILAEYGSVIPDGAAVLVKGEPNTEYAMPSTDASATYTGTNLMVANTVLRYLPATESGKTNYYFDGTQFVKASGGETIHEKQAYLSVTATADAIPLYVPEPEVTPAYGTYDFRKFAVENVSANTDKITAEKDANGVLTGVFTSTADGITVSGSMTLNDAFSVTGSKAANVKMRKNGSSTTSTTSGLFINKNQATLNLLKLKSGDYFKIEYEGGLTFASANVRKQGASSNVAVDDEVVSGASYIVDSGTEVNLNFGRSDIASYIFTVVISETAIVNQVEGDLYISPNGNDSNPGTREAPLKTLKAAQEKAESGQTIAILAGTYNVTNAEYMDKSSSTWNVVYNLDKKSISYIGEVGSDGKRPVFDFSGVTPEDGKRITGFYLTSSGITIKNIETIGIQIPVSSSNVQSENFRLNGASNCLIKNVAAHDGYGIGFYLTGKTTNCVIEDCDAYNNADKTNNTGENNDGFGCHVSENCPGNKFVRCRAWYNADDGFDFISCYSVATVEDCIAWRNGRTDSNFSNIKGNGNGFKAGGYGMKSDETGKAHPMHVVTGCIAVDQPHGFYANHHLGGLKFENNRAYKNSLDYLMTNRKGEGTSSSDLTDVSGYNHEIIGNISYGNTDISKVVGEIDTETCTLAGNSFSYSDGSWTNKEYTNDDFVNLTVSDLLLDRDEDGNLPEAVFNFMKLKVPAEIIEDPTITLKSADESKTIYTVTYPADAELHYKLPGSTKEQTATTSATTDIEVTTAGILQVWAVKGNSSSSVVKQSVLLLTPVVYDFANTTSDIKADDGTKVRLMTYKDHNDKAQRNQEFWYVMEESAKLRVLTYKEAGKFTEGTGLSLTKANRPIGIEGVKAGDFVRIFHNGGTLLDGNVPDVGTTITDANGNAFTGGIESGQLIKITATTGNVDDYVMFQSTTQNFTVTKIVINTALDPVVEKDEAKSNESKWVYNVSFYEGETLHYTSPDLSGEQTVTYTGSPVTIEVANAGKLVCWTTMDSRTSSKVSRTIDKVNAPAEVSLSVGYQTYYAEKALDFTDISNEIMRAYMVKANATATTRAASASQLELVEVKKVPAKTALILWGKKAVTVEIAPADASTSKITEVSGTETDPEANLLKKAERTETEDATKETMFVPNTDGELSFNHSGYVSRGSIYLEIPSSLISEDTKEITLGDPQEDGTIVPLETVVATVKNITPILDTENSTKSKKVYIFKFDSSLKLYYKRPGQDTEFRGQSYKEGFEDSGFTVNSTYSGYLEYYVVKNGESSRTEAKEIMLVPVATRTQLDKSSATYEISFFDGATLYYTLGDDAEKTVDTGSPLELTLTKGAKITAYSKTKAETTESLSTNLYAPTPSIAKDSVYQFANVKNQIGIDYVLTTTGYEDGTITLGKLSLNKPNALTSQTLDRFAFSAPRADGKGETSDWRLLNAGRLRAAKSEVDKHLLIQGVKKGNVLLITYSGGATINYVASSSTAKLGEDVAEITSNQKYVVQNDGDLLLKIPADANNNCDITVISLSSKYVPSSGNEKSSTAPTIGFYRLQDSTTAIWRFEWTSGRELHYILESEETEHTGGKSGTYDLYISQGDKVQAWTTLDNDTSKIVSATLFPPTGEMIVDGNYDFAEPSDELYADMPIILDNERTVVVEGQTLYYPNALTYETFKDRFAFSEFPATSTLRMRKNRSLTFAKGEDVKMGILNLKAGDVVAFDYTGTIEIENSAIVQKETNRTRGAGTEMESGESYIVQQDGHLLLNMSLKDSTVVITKMYIGSVPGSSASKAIDFVSAGEEFEALEFGSTASVYIYNKEKAQAFKRITNDSWNLPIDSKLSTESGNGTITTNGIAASNRRIAIHELGKGDQIKLRFSSGGVTYEGHEKNGNVISINGQRLAPGDSLRSGDIMTVDQVNYPFNYIVLKLNSKANVSGIYINAEETEKISMPTLVDKGNNTIQITAGKSSVGNQVTTCYTVDGTEPTRINGTSGPYEEFDVQLLGGGIVTIKAISYTDSGLLSKVAELTIFANDLVGSGSGKSNTRGVSGTFDMQGNKINAPRRGQLYIKDGKVVFFE